ncbi:MAG: hypothetical protein JW834_03135 [Candidatus Diapherotrites archaeon]|nr:hypothetical protein [Candidatus Diapherotrites archaeon]
MVEPRQKAYRKLGEWAGKYNALHEQHAKALGQLRLFNRERDTAQNYKDPEFRKQEKALIKDILKNKEILNSFTEEELLTQYIKKQYGDKAAIALGGSEALDTNQRGVYMDKGGVKFKDYDVVVFTPQDKTTTSEFPDMHEDLFGYIMLIKKGLLDEKIKAKRMMNPKYEMTIHNSQFLDLHVLPKEMPAYHSFGYSTTQSVVKNLARLGLKPLHDHDFVRAWEHSEKAIAVMELLSHAENGMTLDELTEDFIGPKVLYKHDVDVMETQEAPELEERYYMAFNQSRIKKSIQSGLTQVLKNLRRLGFLEERQIGKRIEYALTEKLKSEHSLSSRIQKVWNAQRTEAEA